jgi:hypothetical protein
MAHHGKNEDIYLNKGGDNEVSALNAKDAVDKKHTQNSDTKLNSGGSSEVSANEILQNIYNTVLLFFYRAIDNSLSWFGMVDGIIDEYEDQTGIDNVISENHIYNLAGKYYTSEETLDAETKILCHFNGNDGDINTIDETTRHTFTFFNQTQIDIDKFKFGSSSLKFGHTSYMDILGNTSDWAFGTGNFTIEFWTYLTADFGYGYSNFLANASFQFSWAGSGLAIYGSGWNITANGNISLNNWHHIAVCSVGGIISIYIDGTNETISRVGTPTFSAGALKMGGGYSEDYQYGSINGWVDELRISKGIARYTSNFNPQTNEFRANVRNMTLSSIQFPAISEPEKARIVILEEDIDSIILNTDLEAYVSRDDGLTWEQGTIIEVKSEESGRRILGVDIDLSLSGINPGTDMRYQLKSYNTKNLRIHGTSLLWS